MNKIIKSFKYCNSIIEYSRILTRVVEIGDIPLGGKYPIRIQSMTTTNTMDTKSTVEQSIRMIEAGSEYIRITAPSINEAKNLLKIKRELKLRGYNNPIIADIHFTPNAAIEAAKIVEKVRINPGNFADRKKFEKFEISDNEYNFELERINDRFSPLVKVCKENGTVMRIGTNHGSLSDRIMNKYGDTPLGMVESALEFVDICESHNYYDIVLSMKSSNPIVMVNAYRLLANKMMNRKVFYPLHLGVTEAGEGLDGRIKSSIGIGTLLEDGLGDTIRVSLTEEPECEMPVAKNILSKLKKRENHEKFKYKSKIELDPFKYQRRKSISVNNIGDNNVPRVIVDVSFLDEFNNKVLNELGYTYSDKLNKWIISDFAPDFIHVGKKILNINIPSQLGVICEYSVWKKENNKKQHYPEVNAQEYLVNKIDSLKFLYISSSNIIDSKLIARIKEDKKVVILLDTDNLHGMANQRNFLLSLLEHKCKTPVVIGRYYDNLNEDKIQTNAAIDIGGLLIDGLGDAIFISHNNCINYATINKISFAILQATRTRISKTDYISCPSCGRTQFDLQKTTSKVRSKTSHLKGLKIAVMGCVVNGPGEMADADYGYVGTGFEKISLYKGHNLIKSNITSENSVDELINLIKSNGDWIEP